MASLPLVGACNEDGRTDPAPAQAGTITVDVASIWYQSLGSGRPLIAVHGGPGLDHFYLLPGLEPLAETNRLILYDQRGLGGSTAPLDTTAINMTRFLDDIDGVRQQVARVERVTLVAHSWGAIPAMLYAMRWPQRVEGLILINPVEPGQRYAEAANAAQTEKRLPEDAAAIDSILETAAFRAGDPGARSDLFFHVFRGTFADPTIADSAFRPALHERTSVQGANVATLLMTPLAGLDFWEQLPDLDVPVLIVQGVEDAIPLEMSREMVAALPNARLVEIADAGHFPFVERPSETFAAIEAFLREREPTP